MARQPVVSREEEPGTPDPWVARGGMARREAQVAAVLLRAWVRGWSLVATDCPVAVCVKTTAVFASTSRACRYLVGAASIPIVARSPVSKDVSPWTIRMRASAGRRERGPWGDGARDDAGLVRRDGGMGLSGRKRGRQKPSPHRRLQAQTLSAGRVNVMLQRSALPRQLC